MTGSIKQTDGAGIETAIKPFLTGQMGAGHVGGAATHRGGGMQQTKHRSIVHRIVQGQFKLTTQVPQPTSGRNDRDLIFVLSGLGNRRQPFGHRPHHHVVFVAVFAAFQKLHGLVG